MCENLLRSVLTGDIKTETLLKWLKNENLKVNRIIYSTKLCFPEINLVFQIFQDEDLLLHDCSQGEFILFFLNYLHESTAGFV